MDEKIIESIKGKVSEEEFRAVLDLKQRNIVALGTDEIFALRDSQGEIRAFKQRVYLSKVDGTLIQPVSKGPWVVSAQGYEILGEAAGVCVMFPQQVVVEDKIVQNPYALRDTQNGRVLAVYARAVAFRFSSKGLPQVCDWTTMFDLPSYRLIDLLAKAYDAPTAFRLLPIEMGAPEGSPGATWAKYPFDGSTTLWINTAHDAAISWYKAIINREKKAIDFAQTFARRNAVKHLLGIQKSPCSPKEESPEWLVTILSWRPTAGNLVKWDYTQYAKVRKAIEDNTLGSFGGLEPEIKKGSDDIGAEALASGAPPEVSEADLDEVVDITPGVAAPEDKPIADVEPEASKETTAETKQAPPPADPPPPPPVKAPAKTETKKTAKKEAPAKAAPETDPRNVLAGIDKNFDMVKDAFPSEFARAMIQVGVEEPLDLEEKRQVLHAVNRILDSNLA